MALIIHKISGLQSLRAVFRHFSETIAVNGCFSETSSASVTASQGVEALNRRKIRRTVCLQNLLQLHYWWLSASQHAHNNNSKSQQLQLRSWQKRLLKNTNQNYSQEPTLVLGAPRIATFGGAL